jgi:hypothetical protein
MRDAYVELTAEPEPLEDFVLGFGAPVRVRSGMQKRSAWLVASASDFAQIGAVGREVDPVLWQTFADHATTHVRGLGSFDEVPRIIRVAELREGMRKS